MPRRSYLQRIAQPLAPGQAVLTALRGPLPGEARQAVPAAPWNAEVATPAAPRRRLVEATTRPIVQLPPQLRDERPGHQQATPDDSPDDTPKIPQVADDAEIIAPVPQSAPPMARAPATTTRARELPTEAVAAPPPPPPPQPALRAEPPTPRLRIGTIEVRLTAPPKPTPPQEAAPAPQPAPQPTQPLARGLAWRYGLVQS